MYITQNALLKMVYFVQVVIWVISDETPQFCILDIFVTCSGVTGNKSLGKCFSLLPVCYCMANIGTLPMHSAKHNAT